jgi:hypothetical protein
MNGEQLLLASDAARIRGLSRDTGPAWGLSGRLPATRAANGYLLFRRQNVEELARQRDEGASRRQPGGRGPGG